jgi:hypothetical protein
MKSLRLLTIALLACTCTASAVLACDTAKSAASATSASATKDPKGATTVCPATAQCPSTMSAQCTAAMRAACEKNATVTASNTKDACAAHGASATSAVTAANSKDCCAAHGTTTTTAVTASNDNGGCPAHGASATTAVTAAGGKCDAKSVSMAKGASCPMHGTATAGMDHCSGAKGASLTMAAAGMICSEHMSGVAHECSACEAWADCDQAVRALGAKTQVVSLKNGAMIVYTAESNSDIKALQSLISKRNDKMMAALSASSDKKLCEECKQLRGAMASGKLHREVVNVERGCLTLITSDDRGLVQKIRGMTGQPVAMR